MQSQSQVSVPLLILLKWLSCISCFGKKLGISDDFHDTLSLTVHSRGETKVDLHASKELLASQSRINVAAHMKETVVTQDRGRELGSEAQVTVDRNAPKRSLFEQSSMNISAHKQDVVVTQDEASSLALHSGSSMQASSSLQGAYFSKVQHDASSLAGTRLQDSGTTRATRSFLVGSLTQLWQKGCELGSGAQISLSIFIYLLFLVCCLCSVFLQCLPRRNLRKRRDETLSKETMDPNDVSNDSSTDEVFSDQASAQSLQRQAKLAVLTREKLEKQLRKEKLEKQLRGAQSSSRPNGSDVVRTDAAPMPKKVRGRL